MADPLDIMFIESAPFVGSADSALLEDAGHRVHRCWPEGHTWDSSASSPDRFFCRAVTEHRCPLDEGIDVAVLVRGRRHVRPTAHEVAALGCVVRSETPLVEHGPEHFDPFTPYVTVKSTDDIAAACEAAVESRWDLVRAEIRFRTEELLGRAGLSPDDLRIEFDRDGDALHVRFEGPPLDDHTTQALGVRALDALRDLHRGFSRVDLSYRPHALATVPE